MSGGTGHVISEVYAFVAVHDDGDEGIPAWKMGDTWTPLLASDAERLDVIRTIAQVSATTSGVPHKLVRFTVREELETIDP